MGRIVYITGTNTGVGKTLLTALLLRELRQQDGGVVAMKPFATGNRNDANLLDRVQGGALPPELLNPFYFRRPLAPLAAARQERRTVLIEAVQERIQAAASRSDLLLVEGCGGLLVPLGEGFNLLDVVACQPGPVIVVARNQLGVINHSLLTLSVLDEHRISPTKLVLMSCRRPDLSAALNATMLAELAPHSSVLIFPYLDVAARRTLTLPVRCKKIKKTLARIVEFATVRSRLR